MSYSRYINHITFYERLTSAERFFYSVCMSELENIPPCACPDPVCLEISKGAIEIKYFDGVLIHSQYFSGPINIKIPGKLRHSVTFRKDVTGKLFTTERNLQEIVTYESLCVDA